MQESNPILGEIYRRLKHPDEAEEAFIKKTLIMRPSPTYTKHNLLAKQRNEVIYGTATEDVNLIRLEKLAKIKLNYI